MSVAPNKLCNPLSSNKMASSKLCTPLFLIKVRTPLALKVYIPRRKRRTPLEPCKREQNWVSHIANWLFPSTEWNNESLCLKQNRRSFWESCRTKEQCSSRIRIARFKVPQWWCWRFVFWDTALSRLATVTGVWRNTPARFESQDLHYFPIKNFIYPPEKVILQMPIVYEYTNYSRNLWSSKPNIKNRSRYLGFTPLLSFEEWHNQPQNDSYYRSV